MKEKCGFCAGKADLSSDEGLVTVSLESDLYLEIQVCACGGVCLEEKLYVQYCPICGRKLGEENE